MNRILGEIEKNAIEKIIATLGEYKDKPRIDIRVYFLPDADPDPDNWIPTKKGINLSLDQWADFKGLVETINTALKKEAL